LLQILNAREGEMKKVALAVALLSLTVSTIAARGVTVRGTYVEARTSEVFAGACVVNSEAGTAGREALLAWKVDEGRFNGVPLDGLAIVAAVAGDSNLSLHEIGGSFARTRTAIFVDARATAVQRRALVAMVKTLATDVMGTIVETTPAPIAFVDGGHDIRVSARSLRLVVQKHLDHDASCGNKQWFQPLTTVDHAEMGATDENRFEGASLGTQWSDPNKRSGFFGTFAY
jgi:hypothetical protein